MRIKLALICGLTGFLTSYGSVVAAQATYQDLLTGEWSGQRVRMQDAGVDINLNYVGELMHNTRGGTRDATAYADQFTLSGDFDLDKLANWSGASFHMILSDRNGSQLDGKAQLGTIQETHEVFGRGAYARLSRIYLQQTFFDGHLILKAGRADPLDFFPRLGEFFNISFSGSLTGYNSNGWYTFPIGEYFTSAVLKSDTSYFKLGAFDVNPNALEGSQGFKLVTTPGGKTGTLTIAEAGWTPRLGPQRLAGAYRFGVWHDTSDYADLLLDQSGRQMSAPTDLPLKRHSSTGYYVMIDQALRVDRAGRSLRAFFNLSQSDSDVNSVDQLMSTGFWYDGLFASRPNDRLGFGIARNHVNDKLNTLARRYMTAGNAPSFPVRSYERPIELNYDFAVISGLHLTADVQYVRDPGARTDARSAVVWGLRTTLNF